MAPKKKVPYATTLDLQPFPLSNLLRESVENLLGRITVYENHTKNLIFQRRNLLAKRAKFIFILVPKYNLSFCDENYV